MPLASAEILVYSTKHEDACSQVPDRPDRPSPDILVPRRSVRHRSELPSNTEEWWLSIPEEVRPDKDQPFYHLLAENSEIEYIAYVSEQNLLPDETGEPVRHSSSRGIVHQGQVRRLSPAQVDVELKRAELTGQRRSSKQKGVPRARLFSELVREAYCFGACCCCCC